MKLLIFNGSPRKGSATDLLLQKFAEGFRSVDLNAEIDTVYLNDLSIITCQACGINPSPLRCIFKDDLFPHLEDLNNADIVLVGSPIYFDSVSSQTKLFIDRINCFRPPIFKGNTVDFDTSNLLDASGYYILTGGEREKYEYAEGVISGMFIWAGIDISGKLIFGKKSGKLGLDKSKNNIAKEALLLGIEAAKTRMQK